MKYPDGFFSSYEKTAIYHCPRCGSLIYIERTSHPRGRPERFKAWCSFRACSWEVEWAQEKDKVIRTPPPEAITDPGEIAKAQRDTSNMIAAEMKRNPMRFLGLPFPGEKGE